LRCKNHANILAYERQRLFVFGDLAAFLDQANGNETIEDVFLLSRIPRLVLGKFWSVYGEQAGGIAHVTRVQEVLG